MTYTVADLFRAARYAARTARSLYCAPLMSRGRDITRPDSSVDVETLGAKPLTVEYGWIACDSCGTWVGTELIGPEGAGYTDDDAFNCTSCRWGDDDEG